MSVLNPETSSERVRFRVVCGWVIRMHVLLRVYECVVWSNISTRKQRALGNIVYNWEEARATPVNCMICVLCCASASNGTFCGFSRTAHRSEMERPARSFRLLNSSVLCVKYVFVII